MSTAIMIVLDGLGVGGAPDADAYGDAGSDTLANLASATGGLAVPTLQSLGSMVRNHENQRIPVQILQERGDLMIQNPIVVPDHLAVGASWFMLWMKRVMVLPEAMVDTVQTDLHELEVVPLLRSKEMAYDLKVFVGHVQDLCVEPILVICPEVLHVYWIFSHQLSDPVRHVGRMCEEIDGRVGSKETPDPNPVHTEGGKGGRNSNEDGPPAL